MKVLLDENLPHDLRHCLPGHTAFTVAYMQWAGIRNGELMERAATAGFDVMISLDAGLEYQQNLTSLPIAVILLRARSNTLADVEPHVPAIRETLASLKPRTLVRLG